MVLKNTKAKAELRQIDGISFKVDKEYYWLLGNMEELRSFIRLSEKRFTTKRIKYPGWNIEEFEIKIEPVIRAETLLKKYRKEILKHITITNINNPDRKNEEHHSKST